MVFLSTLRRRHRRPEIMDEPDLDAARHHHALRGLERINRWSGSARSLWSRSEVVHVDGPRSVEGAYTPEEALELAKRAGLRGATVRRSWPCRFLLSWERT